MRAWSSSSGCGRYPQAADELRAGASYWSLVLELSAGALCWSFMLELRAGASCWSFVLELCAGGLCWSFVLEPNFLLLMLAADAEDASAAATSASKI